MCFDLFHTLVDVGAVPERVGRYTADILGVDREAWNRACFGPQHDICRPTDHLESLRQLAHSLDPSIPITRIEEAVEERQRRFDHSLLNIDLDTLTALRALRKRGLRLALVSNASSGEVSAWPRSPLAPLFDVAVFSCDCGARKPEAPIYRRALQALSLAGSDCLFVGDGGSDEHRGARAVGLHPVLITRHIAGHFSAERLAARSAHVDWIVDTVADLETLLESWRDAGGASMDPVDGVTAAKSRSEW
ncbi:MAG: HAD family hydrolase [Gammaproteobacteria bacterium]